MKWLIFFFLIAQSIIARSQLYQHQWLSGGNAQFSHSKSKVLKMTNIQIAPNVGYFVKDRLAIGLRPTFESETTSGGEKWRNSSITLSPFLRYYFLSVDQIVNLFADGSAGYSWNKYRNFTYPATYTYHAHHFTIMGGPAIFLNDHSALEFTINYSYFSRGPIDTTATNQLHFGVGFQIHLGKNLKERERLIQTQ